MCSDTERTRRDTARTQGSEEYETIVSYIPDDFSNPADSLAEIRAKFDFVHGQPAGDGVVLEETPAGVWVRPTAGHDDRAVFFVHSGGFVTSTAAMCAFWAANVARECGLAVFVAEYSLAPEHRFPTQLDELTAAYTGLLNDGLDRGRTLFMGDSCGGGMALALMTRLRDDDAPLPAAFVGFGGWYDLVASGIEGPGNDPFVNPDWMRLRAEDYVGPHGDPAAPLVSPAHAALHGLPSMLLQTGEVDPCRAGAERVAARADTTTIDIVPAVAQGFQGMGTHIREVAEAWNTLAAWVDDQVPPAN